MERVLIVSANSSAGRQLTAALTGAGCGGARPAFAASGAEARRLLSGQSFELVLINTPLPDEFGSPLALDAVDKTTAGVLLLAGAEAAAALGESLGPHGVLVLAKPFSSGQFAAAVRLCAACSARLAGLAQENRRLQKKVAQIRLVSQAKCCLVQNRGMTEEQAHRYIEQLAMDTRRSREEVARELIGQL